MSALRPSPPRRLLDRFLRCERGGFAVWMGVAFPALTMLAFGAVELSEVSREKTRLQDTADAAAVMAARELSMAYTSGVKERAEGYALSQLADVSGKSTITAQASLNGSQATVEITSNRMGFFANLLPPGGFWTKVSSTAGSESRQPLCVLGLHADAGAGPVVNVSGTSSLLATGCVVHSNSNLQVSSTNTVGITAAAVRAVGSATGTINPTASPGATSVTDPFRAREFPFPTCVGRPTRLLEYKGIPAELPEGLHCGGIDVPDDTTLTLGSGVHYFAEGHLTLSNTARLVGENVVLVFGPSSKLKAQPRAYVSLTGRESGPYAGMVMISTPTNTSNFEIFSNNVDRLEGVVYLPNTTLIIKGAPGGKIAEDSDWTITATKWLKIEGDAQLVIRTDYAASTVPVPSGLTVSNGGGDVRIIR